MGNRRTSSAKAWSTSRSRPCSRLSAQSWIAPYRSAIKPAARARANPCGMSSLRVVESPLERRERSAQDDAKPELRRLP